jgi:hypothetical protein
MAEAVRRLGIPAHHVLFGHTHRAGPFPHDAPGEWRSGEVLLANSGCWVYESTFMGTVGAASPFWPGACVVVEDDGPPELVRLLDDLAPAELASLVREARAEGWPSGHAAAASG